MTIHPGLARGAGLCLVLSLGACSVLAPEPAPPPTAPPPAPSTPTPVTKAEQPRQSQPAISAHRDLLLKAQQATIEGDYDTALALLERAQRIDPDDAQIYLQLAQTHKTRGDQSMSRASAERGLLYCSGNSQCEALRKLSR